MVETDSPDRRVVLEQFPDHARGLLNAIHDRLAVLPEKLWAREITIDDFSRQAEALHDYIIEHGQVCYTASRFLRLPTDPTPVLHALNWNDVDEDGENAGVGPGLERAFHALRALICDAEAMVEDQVDAPVAVENELDPAHSADFTFVRWYGTEYQFALGVQSSAVQVLWDEWQTSGLGLHQDTICNAIDTERDSFRMDKAFRNHSALGRMIQKIGDGKYKLAKPDPNTSTGKKSAGIPSKTRRKPR